MIVKDLFININKAMLSKSTVNVYLAQIFGIETSGDSIIVIKYLDLLLLALFITRRNGRTISIESTAVLDQ